MSTPYDHDLARRRLEAGFPFGICCCRCSREITFEVQMGRQTDTTVDGEPIVETLCLECWTEDAP